MMLSFYLVYDIDAALKRFCSLLQSCCQPRNIPGRKRCLAIPYHEREREGYALLLNEIAVPILNSRYLSAAVKRFDAVVESFNQRLTQALSGLCNRNRYEIIAAYMSDKIVASAKQSLLLPQYVS